MPNEVIPIERRSARYEVFERLRRWIEEGALRPGEAIKDSEIAATLGVSRTPVREALQMLEQHGAVEMLPGRLTRVTEVTPEDVALVYAPLSALQALAAQIATGRATEAHVAEMVAHNERLLAAIDAPDPMAAREADRSFHGVLLRLAENPYLEAAVEPMLMHIRRLEARYFAETGPGHASYEQHNQIVAAVAAGNATASSEITRKNFLRFWTPAAASQPSN